MQNPTPNQIYSTSTNYGVVFGNWDVGEIDSNSRIILPKSKVQKFYLIFFGTKNAIINWEFQIPKNKELVIINIIIDQNITELELNQNIMLKKSGSKLTQITIGVQLQESEFTINQKITIAKTAQNSQTTQYIKILKLNPKAKSVVKPILKINCQDASANHGVAIGDLETHSQLLLQSRGINASNITNILSKSFVHTNLPKNIELCWVDIINKQMGDVFG